MNEFVRRGEAGIAASQVKGSHILGSGDETFCRWWYGKITDEEFLRADAIDGWMQRQRRIAVAASQLMATTDALVDEEFLLMAEGALFGVHAVDDVDAYVKRTIEKLENRRLASAR